MKKLLSVVMAMVLFLGMLAGCAFGGANSCSSESSSSSSSFKENTGKLASIAPVSYYENEIVTAEETEAGDVDTWAGAVVHPYPINGDINNNGVQPNSVIHSPWHTLKINGEDVPVYSARAAKGVHSWAWVDVTSHKKNFKLEVELTMNEEYGKCVVLPQSAGVDVEIKGKTFKSEITEYGSFTYTFEKDADAEHTDPTAAPLTIMVTQEEEFEIPEDYEVVEIQPGRHEASDLIFTDEYTVYVMKAGLHEIIGGISLPSNSNLYIEHGAYLKGLAFRDDAGKATDDSVLIYSGDTYNVHVKSRGLIDCGSLFGAPDKHKAAFNFSRMIESSVDGLVIINSNNWTMCFYYCDNVTIERNLLIAYRQNSDGIMMSECVNSVGRYNFVRTGDDGIEFKGTGWGGGREGNNCLYEYNAVWTDKCTGYGIIWENSSPMKDMVFRHNSVGFALPTWAAGMPAIDIRLGVNGNTRWGDVTFEDIEIYHVVAPNVITVRVTGNGKDTFGAICENILYKDITVHSVETGVFLLRMEYNGYGSIKNIQLENVNFCGLQISEEHKSNSTIFKNLAGNVFNKELTIK